MDAARLAEIRERAERATAGVWELKKDGRYEDHDECRIELPDDDIELCRYENGEFIAHAREDVPAMLDEIARLRTIVENAQDCYVTEMAAHSRTRMELEAAKEDMRLGGMCESCVSRDCNAYKHPCYECVDGSLWQWRGPCPANSPAPAMGAAEGGGEG